MTDATTLLIAERKKIRRLLKQRTILAKALRDILLLDASFARAPVGEAQEIARTALHECLMKSEAR